MIRLFIIEDHITLTVAAFKRLFFPTRDGIEVTGYAKTVEDAIKSADSCGVDVFILDLWLENRLPIDNIRNLKLHFPEKPVIIYTLENSIFWKKRMLDEDAKGYVVKT